MRHRSYRKGAAADSAFVGAMAEERERRAANAAKARTRKQSGDGLEHHLEFAHHTYLRAEQGYVVKQHPRVFGPQNALQYGGAAEADYMGWVTLDGDGFGAHPVAFDAKSTTAATFTVPSDPKDRRTLLHQCEVLIDFAKGPGALAFILAVDRTLGCGWYLFPGALRVLLREQPVPLRSLRRGPEAALSRCTHHEPMFPLAASTLELAQGKPLVDWRAGLQLIYHNGA